ncbi:Piwi domain-containing protein [Blyttiomyces helicus]|uniref:Piwi domain-containing protein n=1 Tax=Blyttiomyces helicus TaxID=388810 RepID=A0A4P9WEZ1_9FUNG|nr:Piwi domain-containing protein [Blyttiomyces helicus]|eukprot:RKO88986.1 Piwi domain-containing protein [Blyttiomyces helicus]
MSSPVEVTPFPLRPDNGGTTGRLLRVRVNIFPVRALAETTAYQYDVVMKPEVPPVAARQVWKLVEEELRAKSPKALVVYDGRKNAFTTFNIGERESLSVTLRREDRQDSAGPLPAAASGGRGGRGGGARGSRGGRGGGRGGRGGGAPPAEPRPEGAPHDSEIFKVELKKVSTIDFHELLLFMAGKGPETENCLHAVTALSTVLRHVPAMCFTAVGANFYTPRDTAPLSGGLEVWRGYHQSIRVMMAGHLGVNVDVAATVFRKGEISLVELACEILGCRNPADIIRVPRYRERIATEIKDARVVTTHRGDAQKQRFRVGKVSQQNAQQYTFSNADGVETNIAAYFEQQYGVRLQFPFLPCVTKVNGKTAFPMEVLKIMPGQRFLKKLNGDQTSQMIKATVQRPDQREAKIRNAVTNVLTYQANDYMKSFGLTVDTNMMEIPARVLPAPTVEVKTARGDPAKLSGRDGTWNMRDKLLVNAIPIKSYAFVFFVKISENEAAAVRDTLVRKWRGVGVKIETEGAPYVIGNPFEQGNVKARLLIAFNQALAKFKVKPQMMFCIVDKEPKGLYEEIKRITLTQAGVLSQCMLYRHVSRADAIKDQYASNVALKINIKLGGATNYVDKLPYFEKPTLICGADVTHAHSGSAAPSVAAVVTSLDPKATKYRTILRAQPSRVEIIGDMEMIMGEALDAFRETNKIWPQRLIFFRDGVSSGQFKEVRDKEVRACKAALAARRLGDSCQLTFIIVQKRHHIRLFPTDDNRDKSGNCLPGTTIDTAIVHPSEFNFVLQSHAGLQGTSRPTLYHVIYDEIKMGSDKLQQLCFNLCFLAERATRSISMVAPAYRAHLAAFYGKMFLEGDFGSDTASTVSSNQAEIPVRLTPLIGSIAAQTMYYM